MADVYNGKPLPNGWLVYKTDDGRPYFHNRMTAATQWDPPTSSSVGTSSVGAVLRDDENEMDGYGTTDGEITTTRGRMVQLSPEGSSRQLSTTSTSASSSKKKKGYSSLPDETSLSGPIDLETGRKQVRMNRMQEDMSAHVDFWYNGFYSLSNSVFLKSQIWGLFESLMLGWIAGWKVEYRRSWYLVLFHRYWVWYTNIPVVYFCLFRYLQSFFDIDTTSVCNVRPSPFYPE